MAIEVLVKATDTINPTSNNPNLLWKQGMIVEIRQSPAIFGDKETPPDFWRITVEGIDLSDPAVQEWMATYLEDEFDEGGNVLAQRRVYLDISRLPPPIANDIANDGYATVAANRLQGFRDAIVPVVLEP